MFHMKQALARWRTGWDSNPRDGCPPTRFEGVGEQNQLLKGDNDAEQTRIYSQGRTIERRPFLCRLGLHKTGRWSRSAQSDLIGERVAERYCRRCGLREEWGFADD